MVDSLTIFSLVLLISLIISLVTGIMLVFSKELSHKKRNTIGGILLGMGILNLVLFGMLVFEKFYYKVEEFITLLLFFIIPFVIGMELLSSHKMKKGLKSFLGILLILLPFIWIIVGLITT